MKNIVVIIILAVLPNQLLAANCGEGDILIDISKFTPKEKTAEGVVKIVDASTLRVKENPGSEAMAMDLTGIVSRKAVCVGELYCFALRRFEEDKGATKKTNFRWEVLRKADPMAKGGTHSRNYIASNFPSSSPNSVNTTMVIQNAPRLVARRDGGKNSMEFEYQSEARTIAFSVRVREAEIALIGTEAGSSVELKLLTTNQAKQSALDPARKILFKPVEEMEHAQNVQNATDPVTKKVDQKKVKSKPVEGVKMNCLREAADPGQPDVKRAAGAPAGAASGAKK